jgi:Na+-transporting NADH:ubiquinone oxidoreductase subunit NqrD
MNVRHAFYWLSIGQVSIFSGLYICVCILTCRWEAQVTTSFVYLFPAFLCCFGTTLILDEKSHWYWILKSAALD